MFIEEGDYMIGADLHKMKFFVDNIFDRIIYQYGEGFSRQGQSDLLDLNLRLTSREYLLTYLKNAVESNMI